MYMCNVNLKVKLVNIKRALAPHKTHINRNKVGSVRQMGSTRIVGFLQSVDERKDENPTRKTCSK